MTNPKKGAGAKRSCERSERRKLIKLQEIAIKSIQNLSEWVEAHGNSAETANLSTRVEVADIHYKRYMELEEKLLEIEEDEDPEYEEAATVSILEFENLYIETKARINSLIDGRKTPPRPIPNLEQSTFIAHSKPVKLPKLQPPKFSGQYCEWLDFKIEFKSMIIDNEELTDIDKFRFLKSCLSDTAKKTISQMEASEENFRNAWKVLCNRYENKALLFQSHINEMLHLKKVTKESAISLRRVIDKVGAHYRSLLSIGSKVELAENLLICVVLSRIDQTTAMKWEESTSKDIPTWKDFSDFLERRASILEKIEYNRNNLTNTNTTQKALISTDSFNSNSFACRNCSSKDHDLENCPKFLNLSAKDKYNKIKRLRLCVICLKNRHRSSQCKASLCQTCSKRHHTLLHFQSVSEDTNTSNSDKNSKTQQLHALITSQNNIDTPFLSTAVVMIRHVGGNLIPCRALLDSCASTNFISDKMSKIVGVQRNKCNTIIGGIGNSNVNVKYSCEIKLTSRAQGSKQYNIVTLILPKITGLQPQCHIKPNAIQTPEGIQLADPQFYTPQPVDLLIGAGLFWDLICDGRISLGEGRPILQKTTLGWIVGGILKAQIKNQALLSSELESQEPYEDNLSCIVKRFWEVDTILEPKKSLSSEEQKCEDYYVNTTHRNNDGSYTVRLPFRNDPSSLGESQCIAMHRFLKLESKLQKSPILKQMYTEFIAEYASLNHLEIVKNFDPSIQHCFLPHHCVMKMTSSTTKLRVVFDASCKTSSGISLNDILHAGPKLQDDLFIILLRFRLFKYVLTADIQKMFRMIHMDESDSNLQMILWRSSKTDPIEVLKLRTVTYGTACGSYLAIKTLMQLATDEEFKYPIGSHCVRNNFYVDDMMVGADSISELKEIMRQTILLLQDGGFHLSKFCSNHEPLLNTIAENQREKILSIDDHDVIKTLGLIWNPKEDLFRYTYQNKNLLPSVTKRIVLSEMASLFDPLGLVCPVITLAKIFYQDLWKLKLDWDTQLNEVLTEKWNIFRTHLAKLKSVDIPRFVLSSNYTSIQIHGFSDASEKAYGACIYLRCLNMDGTISVQLLCAKSRIAPVKTITLARLELLAAKLLADLRDQVRDKVLNFLKIDQEFFWTDSLITLHWLHKEPHNWTTFVAHRVTKIQDTTKNGTWRHVPSNFNPADIISRGSLPDNICSSKSWFNGPDFLTLEQDHWPSPQIPFIESKEIPESRLIKFALISEKIEDITANMNFSLNFRGTRRAFAYVLKFIKNCLPQDSTRFAFLSKNLVLNKKERSKLINSKDIYSKVCIPTIADEEEAEKMFLKVIQKVHFDEDYVNLKNNRAVSHKSQIKSLAPFLDNLGIIRVGGRIKRAKIPFNSKHQILLPRAHQFTLKLIEYTHYIRSFHSGPQLVLSKIREKYWPINGLIQTKTIIRKCVWCFRMRPTFYKQIMGDLPEHRVNFSNTYPFAITGVDFAGPLSVKHHIRCKAPKKTYLALFICFSTKAVHMELVVDLSTEAFIRALKRFIADRGKVLKIYSDNATNFVGTANQLRDVKNLLKNNKSAIESVCRENMIEWSFIPPRSPNFGGLWEASIKIAKRLIKNIIGLKEVTVDELQTIIKLVAAIINSRPITPLSSDPNDFEALTPNHFLHQGPHSCLLEPIPQEININLVKMYQYISWVTHQFWLRFRKEYLGTLQQRTKWMYKKNNIKIGSMVLLKDPILNSTKWIIGRVTDVFPDSNGDVRVVKIKTKDGNFERSLSGIAILPIEN